MHPILKHHRADEGEARKANQKTCTEREEDEMKRAGRFFARWRFFSGHRSGLGQQGTLIVPKNRSVKWQAERRNDEDVYRMCGGRAVASAALETTPRSSSSFLDQRPELFSLMLARARCSDES
jgi:hypothetical protein